MSPTPSLQRSDFNGEKKEKEGKQNPLCLFLLSSSFSIPLARSFSLRRKKKHFVLSFGFRTEKEEEEEALKTVGWAVSKRVNGNPSFGGECYVIFSFSA